MTHLETAGHKILRVWGFNDVKTVPGSGTVYFQSFSGSTATINTGANGLQRLDAVVKSAEKHGVKLIINFVNNWTDYGGMAAYFSACGVSSNAQWYQATKCQNLYQNYIKAVVARYKTSTAVFAWELANEPRCNGCNTTVLTSWIRTTSDYIRSLDLDHMITVGDEGFGLAGGDGSYPYQFGEGIDWAANLALPNISFGTFHFYPDSWSVSTSSGSQWVTAHANVCKSVKKPCLFEEYGVTQAAQHCPIESQWQNASLALKDAGMAADLFWQLGDTIKSTGQQTSNDGNTIYYGTSDWTCLVTNHVKAIG
jgi:mannan endo-1,4-beta-mannosidase